MARKLKEACGLLVFLLNAIPSFGRNPIGYCTILYALSFSRNPVDYFAAHSGIVIQEESCSVPALFFF